MIEPPAAALVASMLSPSGFERISDAYRCLGQFRTGKGDFFDADLNFHVAILQTTGNRFLAAIGGIVRAILERDLRLASQA